MINRSQSGANKRLPTQRQRRFAELVRRALAPLLHDENLTGIKPGNMAIHEVAISRDLKYAWIYVFPLDQALHHVNGKENLCEQDLYDITTLNAAVPKIREQMVKSLYCKYSPNIRFCLDPVYVSSGRIERLLQAERAQASTSSPSEA